MYEDKQPTHNKQNTMTTEYIKLPKPELTMKEYGNILFLTRPMHDKMMDENHPLLQALFACCKDRKWALTGVQFFGLPEKLWEDGHAFVKSN